MARRLLGTLKAVTAVSVIMAGTVLLKYAFLLEHLNLK